MIESFAPGKTVWMEIAGEPCEVQELIGSGGQGQVYRASLNGKDCALKWYHPNHATQEQHAAIERLVHKGAPNDKFLWPLDLARCEGDSGFGYLMALREPRFRGMADLMSRVIEPSYQTLTTLALELTASFLQLHSLGLCYSDISFGNIFLDPESGEISICDNDNVAVDGEGQSGILGTPRFMAPELVREEIRPTISTDLYSMAVILFYMFMIHHPLEGRREKEIGCLDLDAMKKLYGSEALFIFNPANGANRPIPGVHDNALIFWNFYPQYLRDCFTRAFTEGIRDPNARVRESEWRTVFTRLRDQIFYCHKCGAENFLADGADLPGPMSSQDCWSCGERMSPPMRLRLGHHAVVLNQNTLLYAHHLDPNRRNDYSTVLAEVIPHPARPDIWGLKNRSSLTWTSQLLGGRPVDVATDLSVSLVSGLRIHFGSIQGEIL